MLRTMKTNITNTQILAHNILRSIVGSDSAGLIIDPAILASANCLTPFELILTGFRSAFPNPPGDDSPLAAEFYTLRYLCGLVAYDPHVKVSYSQFGDCLDNPNIYVAQSYRRLLMFSHLVASIIPDVITAARMTATNELAAWDNALAGAAATSSGLIILDSEIFHNEAAMNAAEFM